MLGRGRGRVNAGIKGLEPGCCENTGWGVSKKSLCPGQQEPNSLNDQGLPQGQEATKPVRPSPTPNVAAEAKVDTQGGPALGEKPHPRSSARLPRGVWEGPDRVRTKSLGNSGHQGLSGLPVRVSSKEGERSSSSFSQGTTRKEVFPAAACPLQSFRQCLQLAKGTRESQTGTTWPPSSCKKPGVRLALLAPHPNSGSWSTEPQVPWSPSHTYGKSRWMQWTKGRVEGDGMQHGHRPRPRPGRGRAATLTTATGIPGPRGARGCHLGGLALLLR